MNTSEAPRDLVAQVEWLYSQLAIRPQIFAGRPGCIEVFVNGIESLLDVLATNSEREYSYDRFLASEGFGALRFSSSFEKQSQCRLGFISREHQEIIATAEEIEDNYQKEFECHWEKFLKWRAAGNSQRHLNG
jgi:hypothetical protein